VLAFDPDYVNKSLEQSKVANSSQYLDKIIQVRLPLPIIEQKAIEGLVNEELTKLAPEVTKEYFPENKHRLAELYQSSIKYLLQTPRDVRKLFNNISMREPHVRGEVEFADLLALETIAVKAPEIYRHIRSNPAAYTGTEPDDWGIEKTSEKVAKYKDERDQLLGKQDATNKRHFSKLVESLFPQLNDDGEETDQKYFSQNGRVAAFDRLMIALKFGLPISEVSSNTVRAFLLDNSSRENILKEISRHETIGRFVELLTLAIEKIDVAEPKYFVEALVQLAEQPLVAEIERSQKDVLAIRLYRNIWRVLRVYLGRLDHEKRLAHLRALANDYHKVGLGTFALDHCLRQSGFYKSEDAVKENARWCTKEELEEIKNRWIVTVIKHATREGVFSLNGSGEIFYLLRRLDTKVCAEIATSLLEHDADVDTLVMTIGESGSDSRKGRYTHVTDEFLDSIGGKDQIRARVQQRLKSNTAAATGLRAMYNSIISGKKFYLVDGSEGEPF